MRGLVGAAAIMGCLKYGVCFCGFDANDQPQLQVLLKDADLLDVPDCHRELAPDRVHHLSIVSAGMYVAVRCIPENGHGPSHQLASKRPASSLLRSPLVFTCDPTPNDKSFAELVQWLRTHPDSHVVVLHH